MQMASSNGSFKGKVLLTGGTGFIASHVLESLLDSGYEVVVTARSEEKGHRILDSLQLMKHLVNNAVSFVVVEDIAKEGTFDEAVQQTPPLTHIIHTASPCHPVNPTTDPITAFIQPAVNGTISLLSAAHHHAPSVKRIVITSSSAAILNPPHHPAGIYNETHWAPATLEEVTRDPSRHAYRASKVFAERAAWDFVRDKKPKFELSTVNNTWTFGPLPKSFAGDLRQVNMSNARVADCVAGKWKEQIPPTGGVYTFVDVRDVALAHVRAMEMPGAGGERFYVVGGHFSNGRIVQTIRKLHPELEERLPKEEDVVDDLPHDVYGFDNGKSKRVLDIKYRGLAESLGDTVSSILAVERQGGK